ncbi:MAG: hypothetical protein QOJ29_2913 [Thermoleophilaceae bacterium]|jgi:predicted dehydrogenase|nr:hypothetical protein [Thermoleophilaceae bacterium]
MRSRTVWQRHLNDLPGFELVGVQDPATEALGKAVDDGLVKEEQTFTELDAMLESVSPDALIACPIIAAHAGAVEAGLAAGCHVLVEKPFTDDLAAAVRLAERAADAGRVLAVVQNWRTKSVGAALKEAIDEGAIGAVGQVFFRYLRDREAPHLPSYLFDEQDPILWGMSIHHFDLFRFALGQDIARVAGHAKNAPWSRYSTPSTLQLWMETTGGIPISYVATFSSHNAHLPLESLQVEGELGTLYNESAYSEPPLLLSLRGAGEPVDVTADIAERDQQAQYRIGDVALLTNFGEAVRGRAEAIAPASENLGTLAAIEAARRAVREGTTVEVADLLPSSTRV